MLEVCCGLCRPFRWEVWIPESMHLKSQNISLYCIIRKGLCSVFKCVLNFTFDQLLYWVVVAEFHWFETRTRKSECTWIGMECFWAGECYFTWASLRFFFSLQRRNAMHPLEGHYWLSRETCLTLKSFFASLQRGKGFFSAQSRCAVRRTVAL